MHTHGIGIHYEVAAATAQGHDAVGLLQPTEQQTDADADDCSDYRYHPALEKEDLGDLFIVGTEITQRNYVVFLVDDEHGERAYNVETCHDKDKREEYIGNDFLYLHDAKSICLLLESVENSILCSGYLLQLLLGFVEVGPGVQAMISGPVDRRDYGQTTAM